MQNVLSRNVAETIKKEFDFQVNKFPLSGPDGMKTPCYGLFRSDNASFVGSCNNAKSRNYIPHQTDDVIALVEASSTLFDGEVDVTCFFNQGHYVSVQPTMDKRKAVFGQKDNVFPRIIINAGYDGQAFKANMGYYRDVCKNLSIMRMVKGTTVSIRHMSNLRSEMDELIETFGVLGESWEALGQRIDALEQTKVSLVGFLEDVFGPVPEETGRGKTVAENRIEKIVGRLLNERFKTGRPLNEGMAPEYSGWELFNAVQGYTQHDKSRHGNPSPFSRAIMAFSDQYVQKAEKLLFDMVA
jgi:hypothetical protein